MTRATQKQGECAVLRELLLAIGVQLEGCPPDGEAPDFIIPICGRAVGVEVTMYQSGKAVAGFRKRAVEAEWESLEKSSRTFQTENADLKGIYILFRFNDTVPPEHEHAKFFDEILRFVQSMRHSIGAESVDFWWSDFTSPLMIKYLQAVVLKCCERGEWDSNLTAGFVDPPAGTIARIVAEKSAKTYRPTDELWLVIQDSHWPSEMVLPINGACELDDNPDLQMNLTTSHFSRVYAFTAMGLFRWDRSGGKWKLNAGEGGSGVGGRLAVQPLRPP